MDERTRRNAGYLDRRYRVGTQEGRYFAHEPVFGVGCEHSEPFQAAKIARCYSLFRRLAQMRFESLLDVGGAEGYHASLARKLFSAEVVTSDVSFEANLRARELFGLPAVASDAHWLPYQDQSFDVVLCCEVLEHVSDPVAVMCEVARVARRYAVFTTEQTAKSPRERQIRLLLADMESPHAELHWFLPGDFATVLRGAVAHERQALVTARLSEQLAGGREPSPAEIRELALEMTRLGPSTRPELGILVVKAKHETPLPNMSQPGDEALLDAILAQRVEAMPETGGGGADLDPFLRERLACPVCLNALAAVDQGLACDACGRRFAVLDGVPRLYLPDGEAPPRPEAARWPWLTEEGRALRELFTRPRTGRSRLLCDLLNLELALTDVSGAAPEPDGEYANSARLWRALDRASGGQSLPEPATRAHLPWWDKLPATADELATMLALGEHVVRLVAKTGSAKEAARASLPARALARLRRRVFRRERRAAGASREAKEALTRDWALHPEEPVTRAEVAVLISRMVAGEDAAVPARAESATFPDLPRGDPRGRHVEYVLAKGIMFGYADGLFHPDALLNRAELAVLLARALANGDESVPEAAGKATFPDVPVRDPSHRYVEYAAASGALTGLADGLYHPTQAVTREEAVQSVTRAAQRRLRASP